MVYGGALGLTLNCTNFGWTRPSIRLAWPELWGEDTWRTTFILENHDSFYDVLVGTMAYGSDRHRRHLREAFLPMYSSSSSYFCYIVLVDKREWEENEKYMRLYFTTHMDTWRFVHNMALKRLALCDHGLNDGCHPETTFLLMGLRVLWPTWEASVLWIIIKLNGIFFFFFLRIF